MLHFRHERYRARPHLGVEAEGEGPAECDAVLGQAHGRKGVEKLPIGGGGGRHAEVITQRAGEYVHLLADEGDVTGGPHVGNLGDVHVTNGDGAGGGAQQAGHEGGERGFTRPGRTDEGGGGAGRQREVEGGEHGFGGVGVGEFQATNGDVGGFFQVGGGVLAGWGVEFRQGDGAAEPGHAFLNVVEEEHGVEDLGFGPDGEEYRGGGGAGGDMVVGGQPCAEAEGGNHPHPGNGLGKVEQPVDVRDAGCVGLEGRPAFGLHAVKRPGAVAECFQGGEPPEGVEQGGVAFGLDGGHGVGHRGQRPDPAFTDGDENNGDDQGEDAEPVVDEGHGADAEGEHQEHKHNPGPNLAELGDGLVNVVGHAGDDVAGAERHDIGNGGLQGGVEAIAFQVDAHAA